MLTGCPETRPWPIGWANIAAVTRMAPTHPAATNTIANGG
jgi:hypothetical protein